MRVRANFPGFAGGGSNWRAENWQAGFEMLVWGTRQLRLRALLLQKFLAPCEGMCRLQEVMTAARPGSVGVRGFEDAAAEKVAAFPPDWVQRQLDTDE